MKHLRCALWKPVRYVVLFGIVSCCCIILFIHIGHSPTNDHFSPQSISYDSFDSGPQKKQQFAGYGGKRKGYFSENLLLPRQALDSGNAVEEAKLNRFKRRSQVFLEQSRNQFVNLVYRNESKLTKAGANTHKAGVAKVQTARNVDMKENSHDINFHKVLVSDDDESWRNDNGVKREHENAQYSLNNNGHVAGRIAKPFGVNYSGSVGLSGLLVVHKAIPVVHQHLPDASRMAEREDGIHTSEKLVRKMGYEKPLQSDSRSNVNDLYLKYNFKKESILRETTLPIVSQNLHEAHRNYETTLSWSSEMQHLTPASSIISTVASRQHTKQIKYEGLIKSARKRHMFRRSSEDPIPVWSKDLYFNESFPPFQFGNWQADSSVFCAGKFISYAHEFAHLQGVTIDREFCTCSLRGGEFIQNVLRQSEDSEYYSFEMGCFRLVCDDSLRPDFLFSGNNHLNKWLYSVSLKGNGQRLAVQTRRQFTIAVTRYEYANLYHTMTDWYNAFILMQFFNHTAHTTNILIVDSHPFGQLDSAWSQLFNSTARLSSLPATTHFSSLVWSTMGYNSLMTTLSTSPTPPLYEQFREFFLSSYAINPSGHVLDCERISVLFIWRHDYVAHPRNPTGIVVRKIHNEAQLQSYVENHNPGYTVRGSQIDLYTMQEQLSMISNTDVLIGMHGAGLTHAVFLPRRAALIELMPSYWSAAGEHFMAIAKWRGLAYERWVNNDPVIEIDSTATIVPPSVLNVLLKKVVRQLCGGSENYDDVTETYSSSSSSFSTTATTWFNIMKNSSSSLSSNITVIQRKVKRKKKKFAKKTI